MAFAAALVPYLAAAGAVYQGVTSSVNSRYNADVMAQQRENAVNQANAQEGLVRRNSREMLDRQSAAFGAAGVGYGGSSETSLEQSAVNQELDALNTRYRGAITGWGYGAESGILRSQSNEEAAATPLLAGAALLKNLPSYSTSPPPLSQQSGLATPGSSSGFGGP
jgi:hypothetical protein